MTVEEYTKLPYTWTVKHILDDGEPYFFSECIELQGCMTDAKTMEELEHNQLEALESHITALFNTGQAIPLPYAEYGVSGKFVVRLPKSLHYKLIQEAKAEGVSLNQYALFKLAK